jgi:predicted SnoaL-like aldol condensation-catalyzing enzyme
MRNQAFFGWLATLALLFSLSMTACQPISAPTAQAAVQGTSDDDTEEVNKEAMRQWFDAFNSHDLARLDAAVDKYYAKDYVLHDPTVPNFSGGAATIKLLVRESMEALPDLHITLDEMIAEEDMVAVRTTVSGTEPSDKSLSFWTMSLLRFVDGQIAEEWQLSEPSGAEVVGSDIGNK